MLLSTCWPFWEPVRDSLLPVVVALLSTIVGWVGLRLRGISRDVRSTSQEVEQQSEVLRPLLDRSGYPLGALDRRKSSTRGTTST